MTDQERKKKKKGPGEPPHADETRTDDTTRTDEEIRAEEKRPESEFDETSSTDSTRTDLGGDQRTFFNFSGELKDSEDTASTKTEISDQDSTAGPVRERKPAASPSASQEREAAGPAAFSKEDAGYVAELGDEAVQDATHTDFLELYAGKEAVSEPADVTQTDFLQVVGEAAQTHTGEIEAEETRTEQFGEADRDETQSREPSAEAHGVAPVDEETTQTRDATGTFTDIARPARDETQGADAADGEESTRTRDATGTYTDVARPGDEPALRKTAADDATREAAEDETKSAAARVEGDATRTRDVTEAPDATLTDVVRPDADATRDADRDEPRPDELTRTSDAPAAPAPADATRDQLEIPPEALAALGITLDPPATSDPDDPPAQPEMTLTEAPLFDAPAVADPEPEPEERLPQAPVRTRRPGDLRRPRLQRALAAVKAWFTERRERSQSMRVEARLGETTGYWRRTLTEIAVLFAIVVPIEMAVTKGRIGSYGVHPHPYWLIVLPMAGARGVVAGLIAAAVASVLYVIGALQSLGTSLGSIFTYRTMMEPILFFAVGFFAGELRDELALRYGKLMRRLKDLQERIKRLRQERDVLGDANLELERRIVNDAGQFGNVIAAAMRIEQAGRQEVFEVALELVEEHCGAVASVLILLEDGSLDILCHRGWPDDEVADRLAAARESLFVERAVAEGQRVNGFAPEEEPPAQGPLVVAPLVVTEGVVKALLCLDEVPASRLNETTVSVFFGISDWVSAALTRTTAAMEALEQPRPTQMALPGTTWLGSPDELGERLRLELERCSRYGVATSFLAIQATEWRDPSAEGMAQLDRYIVTHFTGGLRPSDELFRFGYPGCYLLVLAGTPAEGANAVRTRLHRRIDYSQDKSAGQVEIFATGPDAEAPDLLSLIERVAKRFRTASPLPLESKCPVDVPKAWRAGGVNEFIRRLKMETSLAVRNGFDLHIVGISAEATVDGGFDVLARHVRDAGVQTLRPTDGVFAIGPLHCVVVLPCTSGEDAASVAHRLVTAVRSRDRDAPYGQLETQVLGLGSTHPDVASLLDALQKGRTE